MKQKAPQFTQLPPEQRAIIARLGQESAARVVAQNALLARIKQEIAEGKHNETK